MSNKKPQKWFDPVRWAEEIRYELKDYWRDFARSFKNTFTSISGDELEELIRSTPNPERKNKRLLFIIGMVLTPVTLMGALLGYIRGYERFMKPFSLPPDLGPLKPIVRFAMFLGAILIWVGIFVLLFLVFKVFDISYDKFMFALSYLGVNLFFSILVFFAFARWRKSIAYVTNEKSRFGTARFAEFSELGAYKNSDGIYIGDGHVLSMQDKGHILTVAGTRAGKGTNLIIPNLLGVGDYSGSWVVIDPKGENAAITARYQRETGRNVVILNPWGLLSEQTGEAQSYNPLDILADTNSLNLVDDAGMIAEMLVPIEKDDHNRFFTDTARSIITGLIMQIACTEEPEHRTLTTLWRWVRLAGDDWDGLIATMRLSRDPVNGEIIRTCGNEIVKLMEAGEETFGSILATVLQSTDFLKSPALQRSLQSGYDPKTLSDGNTALYIIIPADKLQSHSRWLRLIVTTTMRAVIRTPKKRVAFILDEFAALGYLPEVETALSTYAGYELTVWPILQSLIQLKSIYGDNWETFAANTTVRQFFNINDNFSADYISAAIGNTSNVVSKKSSWTGVEEAETNARPLVTPDEVRRGSAHMMFTFLAGHPVTLFSKVPYYQMSEKITMRGDKNPYIN